jgi:hypothetical protein
VEEWPGAGPVAMPETLRRCTGTSPATTAYARADALRLTFAAALSAAHQHLGP